MTVKNCNHCGKETTNPKFCSKSCAAKETNKTPKRKLLKKCSQCESIVRSYRSNLCEHHFQEYQKTRKEYLLNLTLAEYINRPCIKRLHISSKFAHIRGLCRSWHKALTKQPCHICGYSKHVELAHIKAVSSFDLTAKLSEVNSPDNIVQLCPNCHWEFDNGLTALVFPEQPKFI